MERRSNARTRDPDISSCRACYSGIGALFYCLTEMWQLCDYPMNYGGSFFCRHPKNIEIAQHTQVSNKRTDGAA